MGDEAYRRVRPPNTTFDYVLLRSEQVEWLLLVSFAGIERSSSRGNRLMDFRQVRVDLCVRTVEATTRKAFFFFLLGC